MTLTEFLLARITEDEANATSSDVLQRAMTAAWPGLPPGLSIDEATRRTRAALVAAGLPDAGRVLAECEAKRRIVEAHPLTADVTPVHTGPTPDVGCETCHTVTASSIDDVDYVEALGPCDTLLALALPYADHPDYQPEWRP